MKNLFFIAGTKGGVGKSTFASVLADMSCDLKFKPYLFDCDNENLSLSNCFSNIESFIIKRINPDKDTDFPLDEVVNDIVDITEKQKDENISFIVDMKAGTTDFVHNWFKRVPFAELKNEFGINIYVIGSITSDPDSVYTFSKWIEYFKNHKDVNIVVVKNFKEGNDFDYYEEYMQPILKKQSGKEIDFIKISNDYLLEIKNTKTSLGQVAKGESSLALANQFMDIRRIKSYYADICNKAKCLFKD